jgi:hypothetical protein
MFGESAAKNQRSRKGDRSFVVRVGIARDAIDHQHRSHKHWMTHKSFGDVIKILAIALPLAALAPPR